MKAHRHINKQAKKWRTEWHVDKKTNLQRQRERKAVKHMHTDKGRIMTRRN